MTADRKRTSCRHCVNAARHSGNDDRSAHRKLRSELIRNLFAVFRARPCADDGAENVIVNLRHLALIIEQKRLCVNILQPLRINIAVDRHNRNVCPVTEFKYFLADIGIFVEQGFFQVGRQPLHLVKLFFVGCKYFLGRADF